VAADPTAVTALRGGDGADPGTAPTPLAPLGFDGVLSSVAVDDQYRETRWRTIASILAAWLTTLPLGAALGALAFYLLHRIA